MGWGHGEKEDLRCHCLNSAKMFPIYKFCTMNALKFFIISPSLIIQQSLTLFYGTPRPRCEWREALASCSFRHGYHVFIPLINIKTKIINKYPILIILFFCIKLIGFLLLVWTHSTFLPTDRYSARDIELVACRDGAPNRTGVAQGI